MSQLVQIDRSSPTPIFRQLEEQILESIQNGDLKPGDRIPSQYELARECQVSRATVQKAIDRLIMDDFLYFQQGKGIYVATPSKFERLPILQSIDHSLRDFGYEIHADLLLLEEMKASGHVAEKLALQSGASVFHIKRLLYVNDEPMASQEAYLDAIRFRGIDEDSLRQMAFTELIQEVGNSNLKGATVAFGARNANWEESRALNIEVGVSLLTIEEVDFGLNDHPLHYGRNRLRSDRFRLIANVTSENRICLEFRSQPGTISIDIA